MTLDCLGADGEQGGDVLGGSSRANEVEDFTLTVGERGVVELRGDRVEGRGPRVVREGARTISQASTLPMAGRMAAMGEERERMPRTPASRRRPMKAAEFRGRKTIMEVSGLLLRNSETRPKASRPQASRNPMMRRQGWWRESRERTSWPVSASPTIW